MEVGVEARGSRWKSVEVGGGRWKLMKVVEVGMECRGNQ